MVGVESVEPSSTTMYSKSEPAAFDNTDLTVSSIKSAPLNTGVMIENTGIRSIISL
jgi:hypothetical protein